MDILGLRLIETPNMVEQFRFPKTKKKRILKKWAKRSQNWRPSKQVFLLEKENTLICHPIMASLVKKELMVPPWTNEGAFRGLFV